VIGCTLVALAVARLDTALSTPLGGLGLNATIVGLFFVVRPLARRLRRLLPVWLPWQRQGAVQIVVWGEKAAQANQKWSP
jgi:hypothetical protein